MEWNGMEWNGGMDGRDMIIMDHGMDGRDIHGWKNGRTGMNGSDWNDTALQEGALATKQAWLTLDFGATGMDGGLSYQSTITNTVSQPHSPAAEFPGIL